MAELGRAQCLLSCGADCLVQEKVPSLTYHLLDNAILEIWQWKELVQKKLGVQLSTRALQ